MKTPILETERLILRTFEKSDAEQVFYGWESDPEVAKFMMWESHNDMERTKSWIDKEIDNVEKDNWFRWALVKKDTNELIGTSLLYYSESEQTYAVGYNLAKKFWNDGYATEAMKEVLRFGREVLKLKEITAAHAVENPASGKVMEKIGMSYFRDCEYICNGGKLKTVGKEYKIIFSSTSES